MERHRNLIISGRSRPVVGYFRDGQPVVDRFDSARSHIHYPADPVERANFEDVLPEVIAEIQPQPDDRKIVHTKETEYTFSNGLVCIDDSNRGSVFYAVRKGRSGYSQLISTEDVAEGDIQTTSDVTVVTKLRGVGGHSPNNLFWEVATAHTGGAGGGEPGDPSLVTPEQRAEAERLWLDKAIIVDGGEGGMDERHPILHSREEYLGWLAARYAWLDENLRRKKRM